MLELKCEHLNLDVPFPIAMNADNVYGQLWDNVKLGTNSSYQDTKRVLPFDK